MMALSNFLSSLLTPVTTLVSNLPKVLSNDLRSITDTVGSVTGSKDDTSDDLHGDQDTGDADNEVPDGEYTDPDDLHGDQEKGDPSNEVDPEEPEEPEDDLKGEQDKGDADNETPSGEATDPDGLDGDQETGDATNEVPGGDVTDPDDLYGDQETGDPDGTDQDPSSNPSIGTVSISGAAAADGKIDYTEADASIFVEVPVSGLVDGAEATVSVEIDGSVYAAEMIGDVWTAEVPVSALDEGTIAGAVSVTVTDPDGTVVTEDKAFSTDVTVDLSEPTPDPVSDPVIGDVSLSGSAVSDGVIDYTETDASITVEVPVSGLVDGSSAEVRIEIDGQSYIASQQDGTWTAEVPASNLEEGTVSGTVSVTVTDPDGTVVTEDKAFSTDVTVDFSEPAPVSDPVIGDVTFGGSAVADGEVTFDETGDTIQASVVVTGIVEGADAEVTFSIDGVSYEAEFVDGEWVADVPVRNLNDGKLSGTVTAKVTDQDGSVKTAASSFNTDIMVDLQEPVVVSDPVITSVTFDGEILEDGTLTSDEVNETFEIEVEVTGIQEGAEVEVSVEVDGNMYEATEVDGVYVAEVPASELVDGEASGTATVRVTDANGETSHASSDFSTTIETDFSNPDDGVYGPPVQSSGEVEMDISGMTTYTTGKGVMGVESDFNIELYFSPMAGGASAEVKAAVIQMGEYISSLITGDLADSGAIDDIRITVVDAPDDGQGGRHGTGGVSSVRIEGDDAGTSLTGTLFIDEADIQDMIREGVFNDIILHEMLHALGFGSGDNWEGLVDETIEYGGSYRFTGEAAIAAYHAQHPDIAANDDFSDMGVPVEADFGIGNAGSHWDRATFDKTEGGLMAAGTSEYYYGGIDAMTLAAFEDMGYETVWDPSDPGKQPPNYDELPAAVQDPDMVEDNNAAMAAAEDLDVPDDAAAAEDIEEDQAEIDASASVEADVVGTEGDHQQDDTQEDGASLIAALFGSIGIDIDGGTDAEHGSLADFLDGLLGSDADADMFATEADETVEGDTGALLVSDTVVDTGIMEISTGLELSFQEDAIC